MSSSRVGSLYYQILLDGSGLEKQSAGIRKSIRSVEKFLERDRAKRLEGEIAINEEYRKLKEDAAKAFKNDAKKATEVQAAMEAERLEKVKEYQEKERKARKDALDAQRKLELDEMAKTAKAKEDLAKDIQKRGATAVMEDGKVKGSKAAWLKRSRERAEAERKAQDLINKARGKGFMEYLTAHKRENERLAEAERVYHDHRAGVQRKWEKRRKRNALAAQKDRNDALIAQQKASAKKYKTLLAIQGLGDRRKPGFMGTLEFHGQRFKSSGLGSFIGSASKAIGKLTVGLFIFEQVMRKVGAVIGTVVSGMISLVKAADKKKKSLLTLTALYGGNRKVAEGLRKELEEYAKATAFSVEETMQLAIQMRALGFSADETVDSIKNFGRLAFGDPAKLKLIAKAYSDVRAQGKLMATEVRQFANQGVPLLLELQNQMGLSAGELKKRIEEGLVGFDDVNRAIEGIATRFGSIDEAGMETFTGQMEAAAEEWERIKASLAEATEVDELFLRLARGFNVLLEKMILVSYAINAQKLFYQELAKAVDGLTNGYLRMIPILGNLMSLLDLEGVYKGNLKEDLAKVAQMRLDEAMKRQKAEQATLEYQGKIELLKRRELEHEAKLAKAAGDDTKSKQLEYELRLEKARTQAIQDGLNAMGQRLYMRRAHFEMVAEAKAELFDAEQKLQDLGAEMNEEDGKRMARDITSRMPDSAFRQGSVDEFMYQQAEKQRREDQALATQRHEEDMQSRIDAANEVVRGLSEALKDVESTNVVPL